tara:strand:- start:243 stop:425 length:183 start_codon:yes stop_codon:yes gene_type:complete
MSYWVVGGKYRDTNFQEIEDGFEIEKYGPFESSEKAREVWDHYSWKNVDDCFIRYTIIKE